MAVCPADLTISYRNFSTVSWLATGTLSVATGPLSVATGTNLTKNSDADLYFSSFPLIVI